MEINARVTPREPIHVPWGDVDPAAGPEYTQEAHTLRPQKDVGVVAHHNTRTHEVGVEWPTAGLVYHSPDDLQHPKGE